MDGRVADGVVIDLGQDWSIADDDRAARRGWVRAWVVALVLVLAVVLTGGAEPVRRAFVALAEVPLAEAAVIALSPDRVFVADRSDSVVVGRTWHGVVAAYALPGGALRWRTRIPEVPEELRLAPGARVVLAASDDNRVGVVRTMALDAGTGALLWSSASAVFAHAPAGGAQGLLFDHDAAGQMIRLADLRTGRTIWSRAVPEGGGVQLIHGAALSDPVRVLLTTPNDAVELLAEQTGAVLAAGRPGGPRPAGEQPGGGLPGGADRAPEMRAQVTMVGDRLLVLRPHGGSTAAALTAFDLTTFTEQWTLTWTGYPTACGPMICLAGEDALTAVDPATGAAAWRTREWQVVQMIDRDHLLARAHQPEMPMGLLDVRTGRVLMRMSDWTPVWESGGTPVWESGWMPAWDPAAARTGLVVRPDTRQYSRFWFATLDPRYNAPSLLGYLQRVVSQDCQTTGDLLACPTLRRTMQIWRLRT
jgi:PQQ-like domain